MYNYLPRNEDELELKEGDIVDVMEKCDDGWFVGKKRGFRVVAALSLRTGILSVLAVTKERTRAITDVMELEHRRVNNICQVGKFPSGKKEKK